MHLCKCALWHLALWTVGFSACLHALSFIGKTLKHLLGVASLARIGLQLVMGGKDFRA